MAIRVDAGTDRASVAAAPTGDCTFECWWRAPANLAAGSYQVIYCSGTTATGSNLYPVSFIILISGTNNNNIEIWPLTSISGEAAIESAANAWVQNTWNHIALVYNTGQSQTCTLYLNGVQLLTGPSGTAGTFDPDRTEVGNDPNSDVIPTARYAFATVTNRQKTLEEIRNGMFDFFYAAAGAWGAWSLSDDSGGLLDVSGNSRNLTEAGTLTVEASDCGSTYDGLISSALGGWHAAAAGATNDITAFGSLGITGAADLDASGALLSAGALSINGAADLDARGSLVAVGSLSVTGAADLDARGSLVAAGSVSITGLADMDARGSLAAAGSIAISGAADLTSGAENDAAATGSLTISGAADLDAVGRLLAAGSIVISGAAALSGSLNDIQAAGSLSITGAADLDAVGRLVTAGSLAISGSAQLTGVAANDLAAVGSMSISGAAALSAFGQLIASGSIVINGAAELTGSLNDEVIASRIVRVAARHTTVRVSARNSTVH